MSDEIKILLAKAPLSFVGTVLYLDAATSDHRVEGNSAVIGVDCVLHGPPELSHLAGDQITLRLTQNRPEIGEAFAFFTAGASFGRTLALTELGRINVDVVEPFITAARDAGRGDSPFAPLIEEMSRDSLRRHAEGAAAVVLARVVALEAAGDRNAVMEDDPDWWRATLDVGHVERGELKSGPVNVLLANSRDRAWSASPKGRPGEEGLWLLHATSGERARLAPFEITHPEDAQPTARLAALRR
jgi:hypothetical protein